jgi:DNA-binding NtrC family response regulator
MIPTVLAVDDDQRMLEFVARVLHPDCHVIIADDPVKAITLAESIGRLDLVIADYAMPHLTGDEMVAQIRRIWPRVEVLYLTGNRPAVLADERPSQVSLAKPVTARQLREVVAMMFADKQREERHDDERDRSDE